MKKSLSFLFLALLFLVACDDECQNLLDNVQNSRQAFQANPTAANCIAYQQALSAHLNSSCEGGYGVNYEVQFQNELDNLLCDTLATFSCTDGVMNGNETGIDCGGGCPPCVTAPPFTNYFFLDGNYYELDKGYELFIDDGTDYIAVVFFTSNAIDILSYDENTEVYDATGVGDIVWLEGYSVADSLENGTYAFESGSSTSFDIDFGDVAVNRPILDFINNTGDAWADVGTVSISEVNGQRVFDITYIADNGKAVVCHFEGVLQLIP